MSTHSLTLINKPLSELKDRLCESFEVQSLIPAAEASEDDLLVEESPYGWTLLNDRGCLHVTASIPEIATLFLKLSADTQSQIRSITIQTAAGYTHIFIAECGRIVRDYAYCETIQTDEGELTVWDEQIRNDPESAAWKLLGNDPFAAPDATPKTEYLPLTSDLSQPVAGELRLVPPVLAISTRQLRRPFVEVPQASVAGDSLLLAPLDEDETRVVAADVEKIYQNPFTSEPIVVHKAQRRSFSLLFPIAEDVWDLLDRWSGNRFNRTPPPVALEKRKVPVVLQLVPVVAALIGAGIGLFNAWSSGAQKWGRGGLIDAIGNYGGGGFLIGILVFSVGYFIWERSSEHAN